MEGAWTAQVGTENGYQYNGKELNEDFGLGLYDYGARWYDAAIGRWGQVDPLAEKYLNVSPFNYTLNNPVNLIDPNGASVESPIFDENGDFLGVDSEGFKGEIIIMERHAYNTVSNNGEKTLNHDQVMKWAEHSPLVQTLDNYVASDLDVDNNSDLNFVENIFTNLIDAANENGLIDISSSDLDGGKINVVNDTDYPNNAAANSTRSGGKHRISALLKPASMEELKTDQYAKSSNQFWNLGNSGDAINILGVHEPLHAKYPARDNGPKGHGGMAREILSSVKYKKILSIATQSYIEQNKKWANGN